MVRYLSIILACHATVQRPRVKLTQIVIKKVNKQTVFAARQKVLVLIGVPGDNAHKIGHKRRDFAFQNCRIAAYNISLIYISVVVLGND